MIAKDLRINGPGAARHKKLSAIIAIQRIPYLSWDASSHNLFSRPTLKLFQSPRNNLHSLGPIDQLCRADLDGRSTPVELEYWQIEAM